MSAPLYTGIILCTSSLLAGTFSVNWAVDHRVIWQSPTEASVRAACSYYQELIDGPQWFAGLVAGLAGLGILATVAKLAKRTTSGILFDGGSLFLFLAALFIYIQNVRTSFATISSLPRHATLLPPSALGAISQIASAHAIIAVALTGIVSLQGAQYYSEKLIDREVEKIEAEASAKAHTQISAEPLPPKSPRAVKQGNGSSSGLKVPKESSEESHNLRRSPRKKR